MAKPYKEGAVWSFRLRSNGDDIYRTGFQTKAEANRELTSIVRQSGALGRPAHDGPWHTTLAHALSLYARERLPGLKGASQEANRINRYLRAAGLSTVKVHRLPAVPPSAEATKTASAVGRSDNAGVFCRVELVRSREPRKVPQGLDAHRRAQALRTANSDQLRLRLAMMDVAKIQTYDIQALLNALRNEGLSASSIALERALLRSFFYYARGTWHWPTPATNPAVNLDMPTIDNGRSRILSNKEWKAVSTAMTDARNPYLAPAVALLLQTAMRSSEALTTLRWSDYDPEACILKLRDAKAGKREVPLTPEAVAVLEQIRTISAERGASFVAPDARILPISYEALKAGWNRACERAGVDGVHLHDLRHTSATRFSLEFDGNTMVLKVITGHKTDSQLKRYVKTNASDVARMLHGKLLNAETAPAGLTHMPVRQMERLPDAPQPMPESAMCVTREEERPLPSNVVPFARRANAA